MRDFSIEIYKTLLRQLMHEGFHFQTFHEFLENPMKRVIVLRHDVDDRKENSLLFARLQHELGIKGVYYFRMVPQSFDEKVIRQIASMGHEIGYHYEDMDFAYQQVGKSGVSEDELYDHAHAIFEKNLAILRALYPVKTICMHGSPRSKFDNKAVWKRYDYKDSGIIGEPYFDIDFSGIFYLTDTGRRWDGYKVSVRDKIEKYQEKWIKENLVFHSTHDIINRIKSGDFPSRVMFTFHPQRWTNNYALWIKEFMWQNFKNYIKKAVITVRS